MNRPGKHNLITDVAGLSVGNAADPKLRSGVTAVMCDKPAIASVHLMGGAPGTRDSELLSPENLVETVDAIVLSGGSAFGLDAATGVQAALREHGRGLQVRGQVIPIVPSAIVFDLINGGDKDWGIYPPYRELGHEAALNASETFEIGTEGAGYGCLISGLKGGLGSASTVIENGVTVAALVAVNALGAVTIGKTQNFWSAPFELENEFGGLGMPEHMPEDAKKIRLKYREDLSPMANTAIAVIATDAVLTKAQAKRLAIAAHDGIARAIWPSHTPMDGDLIYTIATGQSGVVPEVDELIYLGAHAASTLSRAVARGIYAARQLPGDLFPCWQEKFGD
ncbi:MAG: P1 family peptidase [Rhizobiaceae bacterium]